MSLKNRYDYVIVRNNQSLGLSFGTYNYVLKLEQENAELKKQLEDKDMLIKQCELSVANVMDCYCERTDCSGRIKDSKQYDSLVQKIENQQKEFIKYLEEPIKIITDGNPINITEYTMGKLDTLKEILLKYKEIIGGVEDEK